MLVSFTLLTLILTWLGHASGICMLAWCSRKTTYECRLLVTLYLFYAVTPLFPFEIIFFELTVRYMPSVLPMLPYIATDLLMLFFVWYFFIIKIQENEKSASWSLEMQFGFKVLLLMAMLAQCIHVVFNFDALILPKNEFIAAMANNSVPNLIFISIPADTLLIAGLFFNPFKSKKFRYLLITLAAITILISFFQGYRNLLLFALLIIFYRWRIQGGVLLCIIILSLAGELSNPLKYLLAGMLINPDFSFFDFIKFQAEHANFLIGLSSEQKAIFSNFLIGFRDVQMGTSVTELINIIPFSNNLNFNFQTGASRIGKVVGIGIGQGTGYNFQLFLVETLFFGSIFMAVTFFLTKKFARSIFAVMTLDLFYSMLRNTPNFWAGQIKMLVILIIFVYLVALIKRCLCGIVWSNLNKKLPPVTNLFFNN